jgi:hypothetical protein
MRLTTARAILYGGIAVGTLDLIDAFAFFGLRSGAQPIDILHSIAAGFLGRDAARAGGLSTAAVGFSSHFLVAFSIVTVYVLASGVIPVLRKQWVVSGIVFGVIAYFVMTWFVVPMSKAGNQQITFALPVIPVMTNGILIHMFGVGLPAAYFASRVPIPDRRSLIPDPRSLIPKTSRWYSSASRCRR